MENTCAFRTKNIFISTILLGIIACLSHFAYELSGRSLIVGLFNPVNESIWEHLKFMFFPFLFWWIAAYLMKNKECKMPSSTWIVSAAISLILAPLLVVLFFYSYTSALGIKSVLIDIFLAFICYFLALCAASHFLKYSAPKKWVAILSVIVIVIMFTMFVLFTISPPELPIFHDNSYIQAP